MPRRASEERFEQRRPRVEACSLNSEGLGALARPAVLIYIPAWAWAGKPPQVEHDQSMWMLI